MQRSETSAASAVHTMQTAPLPMNSVWRTIRGYILWQYERGTLHYDIMVTLILLFIFLSPYWIHYHDKPPAAPPHPTEIVVATDAEGHVVYQIPAASIASGDEAAIRTQILRMIAPISGEVRIISYAPVLDGTGRMESYRVVAQR